MASPSSSSSSSSSSTLNPKAKPFLLCPNSPPSSSPPANHSLSPFSSLRPRFPHEIFMPPTAPQPFSVALSAPLFPPPPPLGAIYYAPTQYYLYQHLYPAAAVAATTTVYYNTQPSLKKYNVSDWTESRVGCISDLKASEGNKDNQTVFKKKNLSPKSRSKRHARLAHYWVPKTFSSDHKKGGDQSFVSKFDKKNDCSIIGAVAVDPPYCVDKSEVGDTSQDDFTIFDGKTSLMIRNIPNQFERQFLMSILDKHCLEENEKAKLRSDPCKSEYDFLYLPMDFRNRANLGYAFVNFTNSAGAMRFFKSFDQLKWDFPTSRKTCEVTCAVIQGRDGLRNKFKNSVFPCHTDRYLPVVFSPPRDGVHLPMPELVGKRGGAGLMAA